MIPLKEIQDELKLENADAWLISDYENKNPTLVSFLGEKMLTRKIFLLIKKEGKPDLIAHFIDSAFLRDLEKDGIINLHIYKSWQEMLEIEKTILKPLQNILMDISEYGLLPRVSLCDYGTVEYVISLGKKVLSSGNLLQKFTATYSEESYALQLEACQKTLAIKDEAFKQIKEDILNHGESDEYRIQQFIVKRFLEEGMTFDDPPIVATNAYASDPHYAPNKDITHIIKKGDVVLIDMWAKMNKDGAVYSDITWMGYVGEKVPSKIEERFKVLRAAIEEGFHFLERELPKRKVMGYELDDVVRNYLIKEGYEKGIVHRTGHNIAIDVSPHGPGVNIDNLESHDTREIIDGITFSMEPGIYLNDFGMRSETNVYIKNRKPLYVASHQIEVIPILK